MRAVHCKLIMELSSIESVRRQSLVLKEITWRVDDKYYKQLRQYLEEENKEANEESLVCLLKLKTDGSAPSSINKMFAGVVTVLECKTGEPPPGVKFVKKRIKKWLRKTVPKKSLSFSYSEVVSILSSCDLDNLHDVATCTSLIGHVFVKLGFDCAPPICVVVFFLMSSPARPSASSSPLPTTRPRT